MVRLRDFGCSGRYKEILVTLSIWMMGFLVLGVGSIAAQDDGITTLHVYTNLVQIPTLVLGWNRKPIAPIGERRFFVSLDGGPRFRVTHVRVEGDDPISLAILVDTNQGPQSLMPKIDVAVAGLASSSLHPKDRVSIYALDCHLIRSADDLPAGAWMETAVDSVLKSWRDRGGKRRKGECQKPVQLWDSLAYITRVMGELPGRRVILVVTDGVDRGSTNTWNELRLFAQQKGVAIFGLTDESVYAGSGTGSPIVSGTGRGRGTGIGLGAINFEREDPFAAVCELSGGMVMATDRKSVVEQMQRFVALVRGRYIVEFPHPLSTTGGAHEMEISIEKSSGAFIRSAGISVPVDDPAVLNDPNTIRSDPSHAPEVGKRRVLGPG